MKCRLWDFIFFIPVIHIFNANSQYEDPQNAQKLPVITFSKLEEWNKEFNVVLPRGHLADVVLLFALITLNIFYNYF